MHHEEMESFNMSMVCRKVHRQDLFWQLVCMRVVKKVYLTVLSPYFI